MALFRGLRAELAAILSVDQYTLADIAEDPPPPTEAASQRLAHLIAEAARHPTDARTVQAFLPVLMLRVFGYTAGQGWLETISAAPFRDRDALVSVVKPAGPLHLFCQLNSHAPTDPRPPLSSPPVSFSSSSSSSLDLTFEFSTSNLPFETQAALAPAQVPDSAPTRSLLAPLLRPLLKHDDPRTILLSPLQYFLMCMVASPANKLILDGAQEGVSPFTNKKIKRSTSLPSTRALYNHLIASFVATLPGPDRADNGSILLPAILDFLFLPLAIARPNSEIHYSTAVADAAASILHTLVPQSPEALDVETSPSLSAPPPPLDLKLLSNTAAVYRLVPYMLRNVFESLNRNEPVTAPFVAYLRILALHLAPWRGPVRDELRRMLFPKPRASGSSAGKFAHSSPVVPGLQAISSTISNMSAHLASHERSSPSNASQSKEARWRAALGARQAAVDRPLLRLAVVRAPAQRVSSVSDGSRTMVALADAASVARLPVDAGAAEDEEVALCLDALRGQRSQAEQRAGAWERNYVAGLAAALGARAPATGVLAGISGIVAGGAQSMRGVVDKVSGRPSSGGGSAAGGTPGSAGGMRLRERRLRALSGGSVKGEAPFFGTVWDRPIEQGELEPVVLAAYWVALRLEPSLGYVPDLRVVGQVWLWFMLMLVATVYVGVRSVASVLS